MMKASVFLGFAPSHTMTDTCGIPMGNSCNRLLDSCCGISGESFLCLDTRCCSEDGFSCVTDEDCCRPMGACTVVVDDKTFCECFSKDGLVQVQGQGLVRMEELRPGDWVGTSTGKYSPIYAFGHFCSVNMQGKRSASTVCPIRSCSIRKIHLVLI